MNVTSGSIELALRTDSSNYSGSVIKIKPSGKPVSLTKEFREDTLRRIQAMNTKLEEWHFRLGIAGMTPVVGIVFDATDAALYAFSREYGEAVFAVLAAIPGIGDLGKAARTTVKVGEQTKDVVVLSAKQVDAVTEAVSKNADDIKKVTEKSNPHIVDDQAAFVHVVSWGKGGSKLAGTPEHKAQRWIDYQANHPEINRDGYAKWSKQYDTIIANKKAGGQFEIESLAKVQIEKNNYLFMKEGFTGFIPDGIKNPVGKIEWGNPYNFVEVKGVKDLSHTGNLRAMLDYIKAHKGSTLTLIVRSKKHPAGATHITGSLQDRLNEINAVVKRLPE